MRKSFFFILAAGLFLGACHNNSEDDNLWASLYEDDDTGDLVEVVADEEKEEENDKSIIIVNPSFYGTKTINSGNQTRLSDIAQEVYPELIPIENDIIGGIKLCAEMSADRNGNNQSTTPENTPTTFYSYEQMGLTLLDVSDCDGLPNILSRVVNREVSINTGTVCSNPDAFWGNGASFIVPITITNQRPADTDVDIPQGTMLEAQSDGVQNIVISESVSTKLSSFETKTISVKAMCAARERTSPTGAKVKLTPFMLNAPSWVYQTKQSLWNWIEGFHHPEKEYTITFYAWGVGDATGPGQKSLTGHAFVDIPGIGLVGYGGTVHDHSHLRQYATLSASVKVSQSDLEKAQRKYYEWLNNPGKYELAEHDCTSFAMDIADAAHIWYGFRWSIQFPTTFVRAVKFYNRWNT